MNKLSLAVYALLALLISIILTGQAEPAHSFFQSPALQSAQSEQSPAPTPTDAPAPPAPTETPTPPEATNTPAPTEAPKTQRQQEMTPTSAPLTSTQELSPILPSEPQTAIAPQQQPAPVTPPQATPSGEMVINEVKLIDTVVQWFAWIWMCLGVGFILFILILFPALQMRGVYLKRNRD